MSLHSLVTRFGFALALAVSLQLHGQTERPRAESGARPNIILIVVNDLRWDETGYAGHPSLRTPHVDRLAREGARFDSAFVTTPDNTASLAGLLSGRHPRSSAPGGGHRLTGAKALPQSLQEAGYRTFFAGRWPTQGEPSDFTGFSEWVHSDGGYQDPRLQTPRGTETAKGDVTDVLTDRTLQFIQQKHGQPYFVVLLPAGLHVAATANGDPLPAPARHARLYANEVPRRRPGPEVFNHAGAAAARRPADTAASDEDIRRRWRAITAIDDGIGRIRAALEASGALENTLVVFTADQGYLYGEHGRTGPHDLAFEEAIRVPLVVCHPGLVKRGIAPSQLVLNIDLAPTLLEVAQVAVPPSGSSLAGVSLVPLLRGQAGAWRTAFLIEGRALLHGGSPTPYQAVRTAYWKYIRHLGESGREELYDLHADHYELVNLAGRPTAKNELRRWSAELAKVLKAAQ